ncbi:MAG: L-2-amino-thiazoline-4-carboxylic acid hydrolase [Ruminococcus callidus]
MTAYMCRMDYVLADIMNMKLVRTGTIAEGGHTVIFGTADEMIQSISEVLSQ